MTENPTATPKPAWQQTIETQDPQDKFLQIENGQPVIDLYDTKDQQESIGLNLESIKVMATADGLNPNILTAKDADDNQYAFNPDYGWFKVPVEIQIDYTKLAEYTEVEQSFIEDGRANIVTALRYAENPTISPDTIDPVYWIGYNNFKQVLTLCINACSQEGIAYAKFPEELQKTHYDSSNKPFALTGFYKVHLKNGETIYILARTLKNPTETNKKQTINLFHGFDKATYEKMANNMLPSGRTELKMMFDGINNGGDDLATILPPPEQATNESGQLYYPPYNSASAALLSDPNPVVGNLQVRDKIISLFSQKNQNIILDILSAGQQKHSVSPLLEPIPNSLSRYILQTTITS